MERIVAALDRIGSRNAAKYALAKKKQRIERDAARTNLQQVFNQFSPTTNIKVI
jgi:hypothetical protein